MVPEVAKKRYKNRTGGSEFKCFHWWEVVRHQSKWRAKSAASSTTDPWISSCDRTGEEMTRPIGQDRAKMTAQKGKEKECPSSQSKSYSTVGGMMSTLKKLNTSFAKAQLWKQ
jgi:N-acetylglucosamine kinase-like BadF-type ATPase